MTQAGPASGIMPIPSLPIFFKLAGRRVLLAGGSQPAVWKAELLAAAGAEVVVCDPTPCPAMRDLAAHRPDAITWLQRTWSNADLAGAALAIGALEGEEAVAFRDAAHAAGVPVNVVDVPDLCDFQFATIIARSPLLIAISTDGAAPVFGQALRTRIEALLPASIQAWARAAKDWRPALQEMKLGFRSRRRFWEAFAERALDGSGRLPGEADREACLAASLSSESGPIGRLILVGLGPGDPDLVTMGAVRALQSADVILHEPAIEAAILALARREAERIVAPGEAASAAALAETFLREGKVVAWVGRGDGATCGGWAARRAALSAAGFQFAPVPGLRCDTCPEGCDR